MVTPLKEQKVHAEGKLGKALCGALWPMKFSPKDGEVTCGSCLRVLRQRKDSQTGKTSV